MPECTCGLPSGKCSCTIRLDEIAGVRPAKADQRKDEAAELDRKVTAYHREHPELTYVQALDAVIEGEEAEPEPGSAAGLLEQTFEQLLEDREVLDRVVRTCSIAQDLDYVPALEWLSEAFSETGEFRTGTPTLGDVIERVGDERGFRRDLEQFEIHERRAQDAIAKDESIPAAPDGEVDGEGRVLLDSADEGATLLTDAHAREAAYLTAIELGDAEPGEQGRKEFEDTLRMHVEGGLNLPATLQRRRRELELAERRRRSDGDLDRWADQERSRRAEERAAIADLQSAHDRLQRSR